MPTRTPSLLGWVVSIMLAHSAAGEVIYLDTLDLTFVDQEWGAAQANKTVDGNPLAIGGRVFGRGVGTHAYSELTVQLDGCAASFSAIVGVDDEQGGGKGSVVFVVLVDGREAARSALLRGNGKLELLDVDLRGARTVTLIVEIGDDSNYDDHADWCEARFELVPGAAAKPRAVRPEVPQLEIATSVDPAPRINYPRIVGATPGKPFLFRIPASGEGPLRFSARELPAGLTLDEATGVISGALPGEGETVVELDVRGPRGRDSQKLKIVGRRGALALTPPMGWNSWNCWGTAVDDAKVRAAAEWLEKSGLAAHGYAYVNIDDAWEAGRDEQGRILTNDKFPDMPALAAFVHAKGLKLGIYSSPGPKTCAGYEGSFGREREDAERYAEWGIDYLKYDWCSYKAEDPNAIESYKKPYALMSPLLRATSRDIVFSLCQYGMQNVWTWGGEVDGNLWRTTGDIVDTWWSVDSIGFRHSDYSEHVGPGRWNDPDMLVVGKVGWGPTLRDTRLTRNEQVTHITLWAMLAAPLLIGCDLTQMDAWTLALLTNDEVIAVDQDPLGRAATRIAQEGRTEVWSRPLADGSIAVALFNRGRDEATVHVSWSQLGLQGPRRVRDLWLKRDLGEQPDGHSARLPRHAAALFRVE